MANTANSTQKRYVGVKETLIYGIANSGQVIGYNLVRQQLTLFLVTVFGIPWQAVTIMISVMGVWDTLNDPMMGTIVDKTRTRYGKLRPYLLLVPIPLGIFTILFFGGAEFLKNVDSPTTKIVYMCITYFLWEFFYTIGDIPFWGLSAAISPNPDDRSRVITSARLISGAIGGLVAPIISIFIDLQNKGTIGIDMRQLFLIFGIVGGTLGMGLFSLAGIFTRERVVQTSKEPKIPDCFKALFKNKPLILIVISNILGTVESIADTFTQYFYLFTLGSASYSIIAGVPGVITGFVAYTFIPALEKRWSSKQIIVRAVIVKAIVSSAVFIIGAKWYRNPAVIIPLMMIWGVVNAAVSSIKMVIPTKMIGDTVDYVEWKTGERNEGTSFSLLTFISKLTGSLTTAVSVAIMPLIGLEEVGQDMILAEGGEINTRFMLWAIVTIIPAVLNLFSLIPFKFYDLEGKKLEKIQSDLIVRHEKETQSISQEG